VQQVRTAGSLGSYTGFETVNQATYTLGTTSSISSTTPFTFGYGLNLGSLTTIRVLSDILPGRTASERVFPADTRPFVVYSGQFGGLYSLR
jgi:hypothetical protein